MRTFVKQYLTECRLSIIKFAIEGVKYGFTIFTKG